MSSEAMTVMELRIMLAEKDHVDLVQGIYMAKGVQNELGEFVHKEGIKNKIANNVDRGSVWIAALSDGSGEGEVVGAANIGSRSGYQHLLRHGEVGVLPMYRRRRIGTCLYLVQVAQALMEGRRLVEDTIIEDNPNMFDFLPTLGFESPHYLFERTRAFKTIYIFQNTTLETFDVGMNRLPTWPDKISMQIVRSEATERNMANNMKAYTTHRPGLAGEISTIFEAMMVMPDFFEIVDNR